VELDESQACPDHAILKRMESTLRKAGLPESLPRPWLASTILSDAPSSRPLRLKSIDL